MPKNKQLVGVPPVFIIVQVWMDLTMTDYMSEITMLVQTPSSKMADILVAAWSCIGEHAIVGAASVVTHDVPDFAVAVGNPAKVIRMLEASKFE